VEEIIGVMEVVAEAVGGREIAIEESVVLLDMAIPTAALLKLLLILPGGRVQEEEEEMIVETEIQG